MGMGQNSPANRRRFESLHPFTRVEFGYFFLTHSHLDVVTPKPTRWWVGGAGWGGVMWGTKYGQSQSLYCFTQTEILSASWHRARGTDARRSDKKKRHLKGGPFFRHALITVLSPRPKPQGLLLSLEPSHGNKYASSGSVASQLSGERGSQAAAHFSLETQRNPTHVSCLCPIWPTRA